MLRRFPALTVLALSLAACGAPGAPARGPEPLVQPPSPPPLTAVFFGDSHTEGTGADTPTSGYAWLVGERMGWKTAVKASGGTGYLNTGPLELGRVRFAERFDREVLPEQPDVLVIAGGANDTFFEPGDVQAEARHFFAHVREVLPKARLIVVGPFYRNADPGPVLRGIDAALREEADRVGAEFIDPLAEVWIPDGSPYLWKDGAHFNQAGHEHIAEKFLEHLK